MIEKLLQIDYDNTGDFVYDNDLVEILSSAKLKDLRPPNMTFHAKYDIDMNGTWGDGDLMGIPLNNPVISGGKLDLIPLSSRVLYGADLNADSQQQGAIRFLWTPNWSFIPPSKRGVFSISRIIGNTINRIGMCVWHNGQIMIYINDENGNVIVSQMLPFFNPVAGQDYEVELNYDITNGETRLFIDGVQFGITMIGSGIRSSDINVLQVGTNFNQAYTADCKIDNFTIFNQVQHISNYIPEPITETIYSKDNPKMKYITKITTDKFYNIVENINKSGNDTVKYIVTLKGQDWYYDGMDWVVSDGTYNQTNTLLELNNNLSSLDRKGNDGEIYPLLHSDIGDTTPELIFLKVYYSFYDILQVEPSKCKIYGHIRDILGDFGKVKITIYLCKNVVMYNDKLLNITKFCNEVIEDGYFDVELIENINMKDINDITSELFYYMKIYNYDNKKTSKYKFRVPNQDEQDICNIISPI